MKSETIYLVTQYKNGAEISEKCTKIYARKKSVKGVEFYAGYGVGISPQCVFEIHQSEFKMANVFVNGKEYSATHIKYNGKLYEIVRTYQKDSFNLEITVK